MKLDGGKKLTAKDILSLLAKKHAEDVFVPECKDGPSWGGSHFRLDAWTMNRSWTQAKVIGYEIKVSRQDFQKDDKWPAYLPCCNQLIFVCPAGLIRPEELSPQLGLLWVSSTGNSLVTKKKAHHRDIEIPESVWRYIVMCRAKIVTRTDMEPRNNTEYWREWLLEKKESRRVGYMASKAVAEHCQKLEQENARLKTQHERYEDVRKVLKDLGVDGEYAHPSTVKHRIEELRGIVPPFVNQSISSFERELAHLKRSLESYSESLSVTSCQTSPC